MRHHANPLVLIAALICLQQASVVQAAADLVPLKSTWKVWDKQEAPPVGWEKWDFDDGSWRSAKAPFGINVQERTARKKGMSRIAMQVATYYRIEFNARKQPGEILELEFYIWLRRDQGLVVYLNGTEIDRRRMPKQFAHDTLSKKYPIYTRYDMTKRGVDPKLIRGGKNVLAMTLHLQKPRIRFITDIDARLTPVGVNDNRFIAGPLVGGTYRDKAILTFDTRLPSTAVLRYGTADSPKDKVLTASAPATLHKLVVKDLAPDTLYTYDLVATRTGGTEAIEFKDGSFRTSGAAGRSFTFGVYGDNRGYPPLNWAEVAKAMHSDDELEFIIGLGDYVDHGDITEEWEMQFFTAGKDLLAHRPFWPVIGNHDNLSRYYYSLFPCAGTRETGWYTFVYGDARFIAIDNFSKAVDPKRDIHKAVVKAIRDSKEKYLFILSHYPLFANGYHGNGDPKTGKPAGRGRLALWNNLMPIFEEHKVTAYLAAHSHFYERSEKDGVTYVVTGGGGVGLPTVTPGKFHPFSKAAARCYHYCRFNITPEKAILKAVCVARGDKINHPAKIPDINETGKVIDRCELLPRR